jgi:hypothetical protein
MRPVIVDEIRKLYEQKPFIKSAVRIDMKSYIDENKIDKTISVLRDKYSNDNTLKSYLTPLVVILGKLTGVNKQYQKVTAFNIELNDKYVEKRNKNILADKDKLKIVSTDPEDIQARADKIDDIEKKVLYLMTMNIGRRLENRLLILSKKPISGSNVLITDNNKNPIK